MSVREIRKGLASATGLHGTISGKKDEAPLGELSEEQRHAKEEAMIRFAVNTQRTGTTHDDDESGFSNGTPRVRMFVLCFHTNR